MIAAWLLAMTMTPGRRITDWRWQKLAKAIRRRDRLRCKKCGRDDQPLHVHHKREVQDGGSYWPTNLVTLCAGCHERAHNRDLNKDGKIG